MIHRAVGGGLQCRPQRARRRQARDKGGRSSGTWTWLWSPPPLATLALGALALVVYRLYRSDWSYLVFEYLLTSSCQGEGFETDSRCLEPFTEILQGEFWRMITSGFVHGTVDHLRRNLTYLVWFGSIVERVDGWRFLIKLAVVLQLLVFLIESAFELSGYAVTVLGLSGVVQGLAGYVVVRLFATPSS